MQWLPQGLKPNFFKRASGTTEVVPFHEPKNMITDALHQIVVHRRDLSREEARAAMAEVLAGGATGPQIGALLVGLQMMGETVDEIVGCAEAIRAAATPLV